jgi:probable rRNA maturation factor
MSALRTIASAALAAHDPAEGDEAGYDHVGIILVGDATMRALNQAFRKLGRTTDVLSFDLRHGRAPMEPRTGEVVISTDRVLAQARRYRVTPGRELARLAVHGVLHLQGFDHQRGPERRRMRARERALLTALAPAVEELVLASRMQAGAVRPR